MEVDKDHRELIINRLLTAKKRLIELKKESDESNVQDALNVGSSLLQTLKSWSTDKDDKNPLIRTMDQATSYFPYLAKNNDQLKLFPSSLIAKTRDSNGVLTTTDLHDARNKSKVRVARGSLKWWLENGEECDDKGMQAVVFLNSIGIRKAYDYERTDWGSVTSMRSQMMRRRKPTQIPKIRIMSQSSFFSAVFEGNMKALTLNPLDEENLKLVCQYVLPVVQNPNDLYRLVKNLTNTKTKYIATNNATNLYSIELRHALESDTWQVVPHNLGVSEDDEVRILKVACGFAIMFALDMGKSALKTLLEILQKTFIGTDSVEVILHRRVPYSDILVSVCQAALGMAIPKYSQFMGVAFLQTVNDPDLGQILEEDREKVRIILDEVAPVDKVIVYTIQYREDRRLVSIGRTKTITVIEGMQTYHARVGSTSASIIVRNGQLVNMTIQTKSHLDIKTMVASTIVKLGLQRNRTSFITPSEKQLEERMFMHYRDPKNWPFTEAPGRELKDAREFTLYGVPIFDELRFLDMEATSYQDNNVKCQIDTETLEVTQPLGYGVEKYERRIISGKAIKNSIELFKMKHTTLPMEIFTLHELLIPKMSLDQNVTTLLLETFHVFRSFIEPNAAVFILNAEVSRSLKYYMPLRALDVELLTEFIAELRFQYLNYQKRFALYLCEVMISNMVGDPQDFVGKRTKIEVRRSGQHLHIQYQNVKIILPEFRSGTIQITDRMDLKFKDRQLFNLHTHRIYTTRGHYNVPMVDLCPLTHDHGEIQYKGVQVNNLGDYIGKHVVLAGKCFIPKEILDNGNLRDYYRRTNTRQQTVLAIEKEKLKRRYSSSSEEDPGEGSSKKVKIEEEPDSSDTDIDLDLE